LEDFLELTNININSSFYEEIKDHALKQSAHEVCGFVILNDFGEVEIEPCENIHPDKTNGFKIQTKVFLDSLKKDVLAIYHSHPFDSSDPSSHDLVQSQELCTPFVIYSVKYDNFYIHIPKSVPIKPFAQRQYVDGLQNCIILVADFYKKKYKFTSDGFNFYLKRKRPTWEFTFDTMISSKNLFRNNGFKKVEKAKMKKNDLIVFQIKKNEIHFGICLDSDKFLHHPFYGFSQESFFNEQIKNSIHSVYRKSV
jgi:proteasome lid subunit RPN8/RPN11